MDRQPLYAQFDGDEVDGITYPLGEPIKLDKHDAGTLAFLSSTGRIAATRPATTVVIPADEGKPVGDMSRAELEVGALAAIQARMSEASDDQLREAIEHGRQRAQDRREEEGERQPSGSAENGGDAMLGGTGGEDGNRGSTAGYDEVKDKPLNSLKTADLTLIAEHENVSLDGANTNPERVKAIEEARKAKASS